MNSNNNIEKPMLDEISKILVELNNEDKIKKFLKEILTDSELSALSKRWHILNLLSKGSTQRDIAQKLNVSLCKITRGAKILNDNNSICKKILIKEIKNEQYNAITR